MLRAKATKRIGARCCFGFLVISGCGGGGASAPSPTVTNTPTLSESTECDTFDDAQQVTLNNNAPIYFTLDGGQSTSESQRYNQALRLVDDTVLRAVAISASGQSSQILTLNFTINSHRRRFLPLQTVAPLMQRKR